MITKSNKIYIDYKCMHIIKISFNRQGQYTNYMANISSTTSLMQYLTIPRVIK